MSAFLLRHDSLTSETEILAFADMDSALYALHEKESRKRASEEVVLLFANSEAELRRTHSRYFMSVQDIAANATAGPFLPA